MLKNLNARVRNNIRRIKIKRNAGVYGYTTEGYAILIDPMTGAVDFVDPETGKVLTW